VQATRLRAPRACVTMGTRASPTLRVHASSDSGAGMEQLIRQDVAQALRSCVNKSGVATVYLPNLSLDDTDVQQLCQCLLHDPVRPPTTLIVLIRRLLQHSAVGVSTHIRRLP
jgi:hypothetical protein